MELRNCPECGRVFTYVTIDLCPNCRKQGEEEFKKVREYLTKHPKISIFDLAQETEVDEAKIIRWVKEGRIEGKNYSGMVIPCERCNRPITQGRFCSECSQELARGFSTSPQRKERVVTNNKAKFHTQF